MQSALLGVLSDPVSGVRVEAVKALGALGTAQPEVLDALLGALSYPVKEVRQAAIHALTDTLARRETGHWSAHPEQLINYDVVTSNQFTVDPSFDELCATLQQIAGAVRAERIAPVRKSL